VIFKIYLNDQNETATSIDLTSHADSKFTYFKKEEEVLLLPLFSFQVTEVYEGSKKEIKGVDANGHEEKFIAKVTEITLAELPYTNLLNMKYIHESSLIWYTNGDYQEAKDLEDNAIVKDKISYAHCKTQDELFNKLDESIRATIIVSDAHGYDMIRALMSGINFNKTI